MTIKSKTELVISQSDYKQINRNSVDKILPLIPIINKQSGATNRLEDLDCLIYGYKYAIPNPEIIEIFSQLRTFVKSYLDSKGNLSWAKLLRLYYAGDLQTLKFFQEIFDQFLENRKRKSNMPSV